MCLDPVRSLDLTLTINKMDIPSIDRLTVCVIGKDKCYTSKKELYAILGRTEAGLDYIVITARQFLREYINNHRGVPNVTC